MPKDWGDRKSCGPRSGSEEPAWDTELTEDGDLVWKNIDPRTQPSVTIVDLFTRDGKHLKTTMSYEDGTIISEDGPNPNKNVAFFDLGRLPWKKEI